MGIIKDPSGMYFYHVAKNTRFNRGDEYESKGSQDFWNEEKKKCEESLEEYRLTHFQDYPKRSESLFVTDMENLSDWHAKFKKFNDISIYLVELLNGTLFMADSENMNNPEAYWNGDRTNDPLMEGVYCGEFRVVKEYEMDANGNLREKVDNVSSVW